MRVLLPALLCLFHTSCTVVDAPETLEELVVFGFEHFGDDDPYLEAVVEGLIPLAEEHLEQLVEGYHVDNLTEAHLAAAGVEEADVVSIIGALGVAHYEHQPQEIAWAFCLRDKADRWDHILEYESTDLEGNPECFLDHSCRSYSYEVFQVSQVPFLGTATSSYTRELRWIDRPEGGSYLLGRDINPNAIELSSGLAEVAQQYAFNVLLPQGTGTRRLQAFWVDAEFLGLDVPEYYAVEQAVAEMQTEADRTDEELDSEGL